MTTASPSPSDARPAVARWLWLALLLLATALRLPGADWDGGAALHPDERFLVDVAVATPLLGDPTLAAPDFPYGHLPLYLLRLLILAAPGADPLLPGRLLSGLLGVLLVAATGALGQRLLGARGGFWAAALVVCSPFLLQSARFYTVDLPAALAATLALLLALRGRRGAAGILWGLAVACKVSLLWVGLPLSLALLSARAVPCPKPAPASAARALKTLLPLLRLLLLPALLSFALVSPWAVLRPLAAWRGPWIQSLMVAGQLDFPYTRQYAGTIPLLYPLVQLALWGLGPTATLAGLAGLLGGVWRWRQLSPGLRLAWIAAVSGFVMLAGWYVKFPRYLLPVYPLWAVWAIWSLQRLRQRWHWRHGAWMEAATLAALLLPTLLLGVAQLSIYAHPHPWESASRWIYAHLPEQGQLAIEHWDHPLPLPLPQGDPARYQVLAPLPVMDEDSPEKLAQLEAASHVSDVIILASARGYGALARQPDRYAATLEWYVRLLRERTVVAFGRCPHLGPLALSDDPLLDAGLPAPLSLAERCGTPWALRLPRLDESFRVYDAPVVLLLLR